MSVYRPSQSALGCDVSGSRLGPRGQIELTYWSSERGGGGELGVRNRLGAYKLLMGLGIL